MPSVIKQEMFKHANKAIQTAIDKADSQNVKFPGLLSVNKKAAEVIEVLELEWKHLESQPYFILLDSSKVSLDSLIKRSIEERPPFGAKSKGFRDALFWQTTIDYISSQPESERRLFFITNNTEDFGASGLHEGLLKEASDINLKVEYYKKLEDFLTKHGSKFGFIDDDYIESVILPTLEPEIDLNIDAREHMITQAMQEHLLINLGAEDVELLDFEIYDSEPISYYVYNETGDKIYLKIEISTYTGGTFRVGYLRPEDANYYDTLEKETENIVFSLDVEIDKKSRQAVPVIRNKNIS